MLSKPEPYIDFESKPDDELLAITGEKQTASDTSNNLSDKAFEVFYKRHRAFVFYICRKLYPHHLNEEFIEDFVQDVFLRAYQKASGFNPDNLTGDELTRRTRGWLKTISANLFHDWLRSNRFSPMLLAEQNLDELADTPAPDDEASSGESTKMKLILDALQTLTKTERDVIRTTFQWFQPNSRMPSHVLDELIKRHRTTAENIRKIRSRAMKKINEFVLQSQQSLPSKT